MPPVLGPPAETPCVRCMTTPTVGYCYAGIEHLSGRVCASHAEDMATAGYCVVDDRPGLVENWGSH